MRRIRLLLTSLLGLALLVGPVAAACAECCPRGEAQTAVVAPPACCGECSTVEKAPDPASPVAKKATVGKDLGILIEQSPSSVVATVNVHSQPASAAFLGPPSLHSLPLPLRL